MWLGGNGKNDGAILKFTHYGKFAYMQDRAARAAPEHRPTTTKLGEPADMWEDENAHELYVADGYGNHRVIVFDAQTGAFKRMWGAYGRPPRDDGPAKYDPSAPPSPTFGNPVHCILIAHDGLVYVCDRSNDRYQVFHKDGTFVAEVRYMTSTLASGSVWDMDFWPQRTQEYFCSGRRGEQRSPDRPPRHRRNRLALRTVRPQRGRVPLEFTHVIAVDSKGNLFTGEVDNAKRIQKFRYLGSVQGDR